MNARTSTRRPFRDAVTIVEMMAALLLAAALVVAAVELLGVLAQQDRAAEQRQLAREEAAGALERLAALPWKELDAGAAALKLREQALAALPEGKLTATVAAEAGPPAGKRIAVEVVWRNAAGEQVRPLRLVAWRFAPREETP